MPRLPITHTFILLLAVVLLAGCRSGPSTGEQDADRMLNMAVQLSDRGAVGAARDSAHAALAAYDRLGLENRMGEAQQLLGTIDASAASFDSAFEHYNAALQHYRNQADRGSARSIVLMIADLRRQMGDPEEAYAQLEEAVRLSGVVGDQEGLRAYRRALLPLARLLNRTEAEQQLTADLMHAADSSGDRSTLAEIRNQMGLSALSRKDPAGAVRYFTQADSLVSTTSDSLGRALILRNLAGAFFASGNTSDAMPVYTEALQLADRLAGGRLIREDLLMRVGNAMLGSQRPSEATRFYRAALSSAAARRDDLAQAYALLQLSHCMRPVNADSARALARTALSLIQEAAPPAALAYANGTLGLTELKAGNPAGALDAFRQAVSAAEQVNAPVHEGDLRAECERAVTGTSATPWHDEAIDLLLRLGRQEDALEVALRRSSLNAFRGLSFLHVSTADDGVNELLSRWYGAHARLVGAEAALNRALATAEGRGERLAAIKAHRAHDRELLEQTASTIISRRSTLAPFVSVQALEPGVLHRNVPARSALVLYGTTSRTLHIFVVTRERTAVPVLPVQRDQLAKQCAGLADVLRKFAAATDTLPSSRFLPNEQLLATYAAPLFDAMIRPIERELGSVQTVLLVPPDDMPFVPLHALRRGSAPGSSLIERWPTAYTVPSLLSANSPAPAAVKDVVAFANAGTTGREVDYELRDIRVFFKDARFYVDDQAVLPAILKEHADLLQVACEVRWDKQRPANSVVVLPDPRTQLVKGMTVGELLKVPPFSSSVVFNCSPEADNASPSFCVIPFGAGASSLVMNGSITGRKADKTFVEALYTALQQGMPLPEAYRTAAIALSRRRELTSPYWMPFALWRR